jgi:hypothetical protein
MSVLPLLQLLLKFYSDGVPATCRMRQLVLWWASAQGSGRQHNRWVHPAPKSQQQCKKQQQPI